MDLVVTLVIGGVTGWWASPLLRADRERGVLANILIGLVGSVVGVSLAGLGGLSVSSGPARWLVSMIGAGILLALVRAPGLMRRRVRG